MRRWRRPVRSRGSTPPRNKPSRETVRSPRAPDPEHRTPRLLDDSVRMGAKAPKRRLKRPPANQQEIRRFLPRFLDNGSNDRPDGDPTRRFDARCQLKVGELFLRAAADLLLQLPLACDRNPV